MSPSQNSVPLQLGPYELIERVATGGMAEVYLARRAGPHGFQKIVALKRILPQLAKDPDFVAMFVPGDGVLRMIRWCKVDEFSWLYAILVLAIGFTTVARRPPNAHGWREFPSKKLSRADLDTTLASNIPESSGPSCSAAATPAP